MDELHSLFENLKTASTRSIKPTKELAELTIFSSEAEATYRRASISSPHGPPNLVSLLDAPVFGPEGPPPAMPSRQSLVPVEEDIEIVDRPGDKNLENGSDSSEATLVDEPLASYNETDGKGEMSQDKATGTTDEQDDIVMVNGDNLNTESDIIPSAPEKPPPVPPRNKSGLVIQTTESKKVTLDDELWKFGSQQDVTEVIGNVTFRMMCAIKPTSIDQSTGEQHDNVRDTFYGNNAVYLEKAEKLERKVESWATLMVYPSKTGPRDIYEALDVVFDEQKVEVDNKITPQYASIDKLPPMVQIQIQRTDFDQILKTPIKNRNAVLFPETLYLDRYMDSKDPDSPLMRRRRDTWRWKSQLRTLEARQAALKNTEAEINVADALMATKEFVSSLQEDEIDGVEVDSALPEALDERIIEVAAELEDISGQIASLKQKLTEQFTDMREYEYKLQAVFVHRGEAGGGHYWIFIYDFKNDVWREYNDEYVTVVKDRQRIFEYPRSIDGTPYYLAYVKTSKIEELVDPICRDVQEVQMTDVVTGDWAGEMEDEGVVMQDADSNDGESRHIEHAKPRPLRPKPAVQEALGGWEDAWSQQGNSSALDANGKPW
jgi:ubiquitin carboxyl-terminal hydrolase 25/28